MGKVQILAVLTMDGCLSSELYDKAHQDLCLDRCGLDEIRKKAFYRVTPDYSISMLHEWRKDCTNIRYLAEATPDTSDYINGLLRMHAVDEIVVRARHLPCRLAHTADAVFCQFSSGWGIDAVTYLLR